MLTNIPLMIIPFIVYNVIALDPHGNNRIAPMSGKTRSSP